jgi:hypothetical protein
MEYPCILKTESEIGGYKKFPPDYMTGRMGKQILKKLTAPSLAKPSVGGAGFPGFAARDGG